VPTLWFHENPDQPGKNAGLGTRLGRKHNRSRREIGLLIEDETRGKTTYVVGKALNFPGRQKGGASEENRKACLARSDKEMGEKDRKRHEGGSNRRRPGRPLTSATNNQLLRMFKSGGKDHDDRGGRVRIQRFSQLPSFRTRGCRVEAVLSAQGMIIKRPHILPPQAPKRHTTVGGVQCPGSGTRIIQGGRRGCQGTTSKTHQGALMQKSGREKHRREQTVRSQTRRRRKSETMDREQRHYGAGGYEMGGGGLQPVP